MHVLAYATDWDGDGYPVLLGRGDCEPLNDAAHPGAKEIIGDGIDQNCLAGDPSVDVAAAYREWAQPVAAANLPRVDNVVLITVDALRFDRVVGPTANPTLAEIAGLGVFFNSAYCLYPGTIPSLYGMAVSDYPSAISYTPFKNFEFPSEDTRTTLFEVLESAKIRQFAAAYHMMLAPRFGITRGIFEVWAPADSAAGISSAETTRKGLAFLEQTGDERFFLWLHYFDPHAPYEVLDGEVSGAGAKGRYDAEVARAALEVDRFFNELISRGLSENTAVILAADHGEEFGDHGATHHGQALYEESTHIPLLVILPSGVSRVVTTPVSLLDLAPTILDLLGFEAATPASWKGRTLAPYVLGETVPRPFPVYLEAYRPGGQQHSYGLVVENHKFVYRPALELFELYDLASDPLERRNLAGLPAGEAVEPTLRGLLDLHLAVDY
jgi:arylsulfatase A-like enzyme